MRGVGGGNDEYIYELTQAWRGKSRLSEQAATILSAWRGSGRNLAGLAASTILNNVKSMGNMKWRRRKTSAWTRGPHE
jgi:hypothetical protein